jgi:hypothetical protein
LPVSARSLADAVYTGGGVALVWRTVCAVGSSWSWPWYCVILPEMLTSVFSGCASTCGEQLALHGQVVAASGSQ